MLEKLEHDSNAAIEQGKPYFVREHALWLFNPMNVSVRLSEPNAHPEPVELGIPSISTCTRWGFAKVVPSLSDIRQDSRIAYSGSVNSFSSLSDQASM
jgi:hypothetical protein